MEKNRGVALILALLVLSFLTVLGGALLTASTIDIWISDNYKSATQVLYLAEAGIDHAREMLLGSGRSASEFLQQSAGPDGQLLTGDDLPLIPSRALVDGEGRSLGFYEVWLRNDAADGVASPADSNEVLTLISTASIGNTRRSMEVTIEKGRFPDNTADPRLHSVAGLENLADSIVRNATEIHTDGIWSDLGGPGDYRVVAVTGNAELGTGTGYGLLLVRGGLKFAGDLTWNGLILVIGQGELQWTSGISPDIRGGLFVAGTQAVDGSLLSAPSSWSYDITDMAEIRSANARFPFNPIMIRER